MRVCTMHAEDAIQKLRQKKKRLRSTISVTDAENVRSIAKAVSHVAGVAEAAGDSVIGAHCKKYRRSF